MINIIVAHDKKRAIGKDGKLPWSIPGDLKRFKTLTLGRPVIMGQNTWESIPEKFRPLPFRTNIVLSKDENYKAPGATVVNDIEKSFEIAKSKSGGEEIFIIGGGEIYKQTLPYADRLYITEVETEVSGDTFFPEYKHIFTKKLSEEYGESNGLKYKFLVLDK